MSEEIVKRKPANSCNIDNMVTREEYIMEMKKLKTFTENMLKVFSAVAKHKDELKKDKDQ